MYWINYTILHSKFQNYVTFDELKLKAETKKKLELNLRMNAAKIIKKLNCKLENGKWFVCENRIIKLNSQIKTKS